MFVCVSFFFGRGGRWVGGLGRGVLWENVQEATFFFFFLQTVVFCFLRCTSGHRLWFLTATVFFFFFGLLFSV